MVEAIEVFGYVCLFFCSVLPLTVFAAAAIIDLWNGHDVASSFRAALRDS